MNTLMFIWILSALAFFQPYAEGRLFKKTLKDPRYPGECYPVGVKGGKNGKSISLKPGEHAQDPNTCGLIHCLNADGEAAVILCMLYHDHDCATNLKGYDLKLDFPHCCWHCVGLKKCANKGK